MKKEIIEITENNYNIFLRDYFAGEAMKEFMAQNREFVNQQKNNGLQTETGWDDDFIAELSYVMADAMLKQRKE
jgi:hypothetical protein